MMLTVVCAGPHVDPVQLYVVEYDEATPARDHRVLCDDCAGVYLEGVQGPAVLTDGTPNDVRLTPGQIPTADQVDRIKKRHRPDWVNPPHNYHAPG